MSATAGNDTLNGTAGNDLIDGLGGNDVIAGAAGRDTIRGGAGNDKFIIRSPGDLAVGESYAGGAGWDELLVTASGLNISGLVIGVDVESLHVGSGDRRGDAALTAKQLIAFQAVSADELTITTAGDVDLRNTDLVMSSIKLGAEGVRLLLADGASGPATVAGSSGRDTVTGGSAGETFRGNGGNDVLMGSGGNDLLIGGAGADTLNGGDGADRFELLGPADGAGDRYYGGAGHDILEYFGSTAVFGSTTVVREIEELRLGNSCSVAAWVLGGFSKVVVEDFATLTIGAAGVCDLSGATVSAETIKLGVAGITLKLAGVQSYQSIFGSTGKDVIIGGAAGNTLSGRDGADTITGGVGNDYIHGGLGADLLAGGAGDDKFAIDATSHVVAGERFTGGDGYDHIIITSGAIDFSSATIGRDVEALETERALALTAVQFGGFRSIQGEAISITTAGYARAGDFITADTIRLEVSGATLDMRSATTQASYTLLGSSGDDVILGSHRRDVITGGSGADRMSGGSDGNDELKGGAGDDTYVYLYDDQIFESAGGGIDTVETGNGYYKLQLNLENLVFTGARGFSGQGNAAGNMIVGGARADSLNGWQGDDRLHGGGGNDKIWGGTGSDTFLFETQLGIGNVDTIKDFASEDNIALDRSIFAALPGRGTVLFADAFVVGTEARDAEDRIVFDQASGKLFYDADGSGVGAKILFAEVNAGSIITAADFQLFG